MADWALRIATMAESRNSEARKRAEFEAFYEHTAKKLHGYLCKLSRDAATADEVLQDAYMKIINAPTAAPAMDEPAQRAYLYRTATNLLRDRWRRQKVERQYWEKEPISEAVHQNLGAALDISRVFGKLSALDQAVLWLGHVEQLSHREIAEILGLKEQSIKVILFRARSRAWELFQQAGLGVTKHE